MPNNLLGLSREQLRKFLPDHQSIRAFEQLLLQVGDVTPTSIEQANNNANTAIAMAGAALAALAELATAIEQVSAAPVPEITYEQEDYSRIVYVGTLGVQNDDEVEITGGTINGTSIGATTAASGAFTTLTASSTVTLSPANANVTISPTGTGIVTVNPATTGAMDNMTIGGSTPRAGTFTSITYSLQLTSTVATGTAPMVVASTTKVNNLNVDLLDGADWQAPLAIGNVTPNTGRFTTLQATGAFGCNGAAVQTAAASGGAVATTAATNVSPFGYTTAAQADGIRILLNNIRAALVANGIMS